MPSSTSPRAWVFGYGSLIWRPDFDFDAVQDAWIDGWSRQFWQSSTDHRGTPDAPGRVVTLVAEPGARCWGRAYRVGADVLEHLDHREQGGYERRSMEAYRKDERPVGEVLVYVGGPDNPNFIGRAPMGEMVAQIVESVGPSGTNVEYLLELDAALSSMGATDEAVAALASAVRKYLLKRERKAQRKLNRGQKEPG